MNQISGDEYRVLQVYTPGNTYLLACLINLFNDIIYTPHDVSCFATPPGWNLAFEEHFNIIQRNSAGNLTLTQIYCKQTLLGMAP